MGLEVSLCIHTGVCGLVIVEFDVLSLCGLGLGAFAVDYDLIDFMSINTLDQNTTL